MMIKLFFFYVTEYFAEHSGKKIQRLKEAMCLISFCNIFGDLFCNPPINIIINIKIYTISLLIQLSLFIYTLYYKF